MFFILMCLFVLITIGSAYCAVLDLEKSYLSEPLFSARWQYLLLYGVDAAVACGVIAKVYPMSTSYFAMAKLLVTFLAVHLAAIYDFKTRKIPNYIPLALSVFAVVILLAESIVWEGVTPFLAGSLLGCLSSMAVFYLAAKISKGGVGFGDIKIFGAIGLCIGFYPVLTVMTLSIFFCALFSAPLLFMKKKTLRGDLPFAPFIYFAYSMTLILSLYH